MKKKCLFVYVVFVLGVFGCTQKVRNEYSIKEHEESTSFDSSNLSNVAKDEQLNSIGIPVRLPYASDLEAYSRVNCKISKPDNNGPDPALLEERGKIVTRLEDYEKNYKGKELEAYMQWLTVAANAINNCP